MLNKIDNNLLKKITILRDGSQSCIVRFDSKESLNNYVLETSNSWFEVFTLNNTIATELTFATIYKLASRDDVVYISSTPKVCTCINIAKEIIGVKTNKDMANFSIAIIDTGLYPHVDFMMGKHVKISAFVDLINSGSCMYDDNGHGTFVTSLICGNGLVSNNKYSGIDKNNNIVAIKALDNNGETSAVNILRAMQWIYDNADLYNIKIVCMSFGSNPLDKNDPLMTGAEALWNKGIVVVSACGNSGPQSETIKSPAISTKIISVGALDDNRLDNKYDITKFEVADFSSRGPAFGNYKPDIIVSGVDVVSACNYHITKKFYDQMSGTSVAAPIVAGVVSLLLKKYPNHSPDQIKKILISNCNIVTGDRNSEGYGWLDLKRLLNKS